MPRPRFPLGATLLVVLGTVAGANADSRAPTYSLHTRLAPGTVDRVQTKVEVGGDLTVVEDSKVKRLKMSVVANLGYHERFLLASAGADGPLRSIRHYDQASAAIKIEDGGFQPVLSENRRLIGAQVDGAEAGLFSPRGPLTREELDLIDVQGSSLMLGRLLPDGPVAVGATWKHSEAVLAALLRLDEVGKADVQSTLASVKDGAALIEMSGKAEGAVNGVSTEIELKAKYQFHLKAGRITWLGLLIKENRSIGHVGTGLDVVARLQTTITPGAEAEQLSDTAIAGLPISPTPELMQLVHRSPDGKWEFAYDRRWFITAESADGLALRMVDRGELVAQCNVAAVGKAEPGKLVSLESFQKDIQRALGKNFGQFVKAAQRSNEAGYRVFRVEAQGEVEQLPILWIYHLVGHVDGRRVSFAFTMEGELFDRFALSDDEMVGALRFLDSEMAGQSPAAARQTPTATSQSASNPLR
ncbi:MAG: hypothetical protein HUU20_19520 [Pirellulales bacterium]|nr:hypothetical protein [Pirellulales bacterium]